MPEPNQTPEAQPSQARCLLVQHVDTLRLQAVVSLSQFKRITPDLLPFHLAEKQGQMLAQAILRFPGVGMLFQPSPLMIDESQAKLMPMEGQRLERAAPMRGQMGVYRILKLKVPAEAAAATVTEGQAAYLTRFADRIVAWDAHGDFTDLANELRAVVHQWQGNAEVEEADDPQQP